MTETKSTRDKTAKKDKNATSAKANKPLTKVVIRRLPPTMSKDTFLEQIQPIPEYDHMYFESADWTLGVNASCRAYFNFIKMEDVFIFKEKFHEYIFVDAKGNEYPAIVEFAPYQRMGMSRSKKVDRKCNTFETSEHFLEFVRTMDNEEVLPKLELKSDFETKHDNQIRSTPLLEFLNDKKSRKRDRDRKQNQSEKGKKILAPIREDGQSLAKDNARSQKQSRIKTEGSSKLETDGKTTKKERPERSEKEKARRSERDKMRREKRQQQIVEKKRERETMKLQKPDGTTVSVTLLKDSAGSDATAKASGSLAPDEPKKRPLEKRDAKKPNERRPENRSRQSSGGSGNKKSDDAPSGSGRSGATKERGEGKSKSQQSTTGAEEGEKKESRRYSKLRNKDRPAIQIYQPGSKVKKGEE